MTRPFPPRSATSANRPPPTNTQKFKDSQDDHRDQFERQAQVTLSEQSQRMRDNILNEIKAAVAAKAKAAGYLAGH